MVLCLVISCARPEPELPPVGVASSTSRAADTMSASRQQGRPDTAPAVAAALPSGYSLTDTTDWGTMLEEGQRAVLRRGGIMIDTVDLAFGVASVGKDSLVFLPVRTDTAPLPTAPNAHESFPTDHVLWTPSLRRQLRAFLPFFDAYFSSPVVTPDSAIHYWGIAPHAPTNRLYAMRYNFRTARLDSLFLNREDPLATDYRYHLGSPQIHGNNVSFDGVVLDRATWRVIRQSPPSLNTR